MNLSMHTTMLRILFMVFLANMFSINEPMLSYARAETTYSCNPGPNMNTLRVGHTTTLLQDGTVFIAGGHDGHRGYTNKTDIYNIQTGVMIPGPNMSTARGYHTATVLPDGRVLLAGGSTAANIPTANCDIYDPETKQIIPISINMNTARYSHSATLMSNGKVLMAGGRSRTNNFGYTLNSSEVYDPSTKTFSYTNNMTDYRELHTATLLPNNKVLITGGMNASNNDGNVTAELYDASIGKFTRISSMTTGRVKHGAVLLGNGKVLIVGGYDSAATVESLKTAELFDPVNGVFLSIASTMTEFRRDFALALLPNGDVLIIGGNDASTGTGNNSKTTERYQPDTNTFTLLPLQMTNSRSEHSATLLPTGRILVTGGGNISTDIIIYSDSFFSTTPTKLNTSRSNHTMTPLPDGNILIAGGGPGYTAADTAEVYDPAKNEFTTITAPLTTQRLSHTSTLLPSGKVLIVGGKNNAGSALSSAELFDVANKTFTAVDTAMVTGRVYHSATLLSDGRVLLVGGVNDAGNILKSAEIYNQQDGSVTLTGSLVVARSHHTATLLPDGRVLITGGCSDAGHLISAELYNPTTGTFSSAGNMKIARMIHSATLLPNGTVLIAGGLNLSTANSINSADIYTPITGAAGSFTSTGNLKTARSGHTANLMANGMVLLTGGGNAIGDNSVEVYDPLLKQFSAAPAMAYGRADHRAALMANGSVLVTGGANLADSHEEIFSPADYEASRVPVLSQIAAPSASTPAGLKFSGTLFKGGTEASDGSTNQSSTGYPLIHVLRQDNEQTVLLRPDASPSWTDTRVQTGKNQISALPMGYYAGRVFSNGIPSGAINVALIPELSVLNPENGIFLDVQVLTIAMHQMTVNNTGRYPLTITSAEIQNGSSSMFSTNTGTCASAVAPEASCTLQLSFTPTDAGPFTDNLVIKSNDPLNPTVTVPLSGTVYLPQQQLTINKLLNGNGTVTGTSKPLSFGCNNYPCTFDFIWGTDIQLKADPDKFSTFSGWGGVCAPFGAEVCTVRLKNNISAGAGFSMEPVKVSSQAGSTYSSISDAYGAALSTDGIKALGIEFAETLSLDQAKNIVFSGGFVAGYSSPSAGKTTLKGTLTLKKGSLVVENLILK